MNTPISIQGISSSILGFDVMNLLTFNTHVHPKTAPPLTPMIGA
jgi:hypothetical protein